MKLQNKIQHKTIAPATKFKEVKRESENFFFRSFLSVYIKALARLKPRNPSNITALWHRGVEGGLSIGPPFCWETPVSRTAAVRDSFSKWVLFVLSKSRFWYNFAYKNENFLHQKQDLFASKGSFENLFSLGVFFPVGPVSSNRAIYMHLMMFAYQKKNITIVPWD